MKHFEANDKVLCVDDSPFPVHDPTDTPLNSYRFREGFVKKGEVYCVTGTDRQGKGLYLAGKAILLGRISIPWASSRFLRMDGRKSQRRRHDREAAGAGDRRSRDPLS